jgi:hypothetical protein
LQIATDFATIGSIFSPPSLIAASQGSAACVSGFSTCVSIALINIGSTQQIVESADPVPSVTIAFQDNAVFAGIRWPTVVLSKED